MVTNFVTDNTDLPDGTFIETEPEGTLRHAEHLNWDKLRQACIDLRGALSAPRGQYIFVDDYGAVGNGSVDDAPAIRLALAAAVAARATLVFSGKTYAVASEIDVPAYADMVGTNANLTILKATGGQRSIFNCVGASIYVNKMTFDGNRSASYALRIFNASGGGVTQSVYSELSIYSFTIDGINLLGNNNQMTFDNVSVSSCGKFFCPAGAAWDTIIGFYGLTKQALACTGTVSTTTDSLVITGSGTNFTSLGLRRGDVVYVGTSGTEAFVVDTVDSATQITAVNASYRLVASAPGTTAGQTWAAGVGSGYREELNSDNNIINWFGGRVQGNAALGMIFGGLYGPNIHKVEIGYHAGFHICTYPGLGGGAFATMLDNCYFEAAGVASVVHPSGSLVVTAPNGAFTLRVQLGSYSLLNSNGEVETGGGGVMTKVALGQVTQSSVTRGTATTVNQTDVSLGRTQAQKELYCGLATPSGGVDNYIQLNVDGANSTFEVGQRVGASKFPRFKIAPSIGQEYKTGVDMSASPGPQTANNSSGLNAIASGATSVKITCSQVPNPATRKVRIMVTPHGNMGTWWVEQDAGGGSFTLKTAAAVAANTSFSWEIIELLA